MGGSRSIKNPKKSHAKPRRSARVRFACQWTRFFSNPPCPSLARDDDSYFFGSLTIVTVPPVLRMRMEEEGGGWTAPPFDVAWDDWNAVVAGEAVTWAATSVGMTGCQSIEKQVLPCRAWLGPILGGAFVSSHLCTSARSAPNAPTRLCSLGHRGGSRHLQFYGLGSM